MSIKTMMLDVDGVVIVHPDPAGWSVHLERDLGVPLALLQQRFFKPHWRDIIHGRAALRERLAPVLAEIAPAVECGTLIDYWFAADAHLNQPLLDETKLLRARGMPIHLATVQEHERARYIWDRLELNLYFDRLHYAADLGAAKPDAAFYRMIQARTGLAPGEIFFVDDRPDNVEAARTLGWHAALWTGADRLIDLLGAVDR